MRRPENAAFQCKVIMGNASSTSGRTRCPARISDARAGDDDYPSETSHTQADCEDSCVPWLSILDYGAAIVRGLHAAAARISTALPLRFMQSEAAALVDESSASSSDGGIILLRDAHVAYLRRSLGSLSASFTSLDASRVWMVYWCLHALDLLGEPPLDMYEQLIDFVSLCQNRTTGGFGGGPGQAAHGIASYAGVMALVIMGAHSERAYTVIDRIGLRSFYMSLRTPARTACGPHVPGVGFRAHAHGEIDVRTAYTVLAAASITDIVTPELRDGVAEYLLSCQTHEGGFAGDPGNEAHGGYTYCAVAALTILGQLNAADTGALSRWLCMRQLSLEGGFAGRANKLVDGCYSFWQGACFALLPAPHLPSWALQADEGVEASPTAGRLLGPQVPREARATGSSLIMEIDDAAPEISTVSSSTINTAASSTAAAPEKDVLLDRLRLQLYLLLCCQQPEGGLRDKPTKNRDQYHSCYCLSGLSIAQHLDEVHRWTAGRASNLLHRTDPVYNVRVEHVQRAREWFRAHGATSPVAC